MNPPTLRGLYFAWRAIGYPASMAFKLAGMGIDPAAFRVIRPYFSPAEWVTCLFLSTTGVRISFADFAKTWLS